MTTTPAAPADREHGSHIITTLERAWAAIRARHPEIPRVVMITGQGRDGRWINWGHYAAGTWRAADDRREHELFVSGELLGLGGTRVMQTLLHEAAHALADVRGITDTSSGGRYHNKRFVALAVELGLTGPASPAPTIGFSDCAITAATVATYREHIDALDAERLPYLDSPALALLRPPAPTGGQDGQDGGQDHAGDDAGDGGRDDDVAPRGQGRDGKRLAVLCGCTPPRRLQVTPATWERGAISCGPCGQDFAPPQ
ncbi:hypothetical protein [Spongiactinospora sp. 9N601]|uniref:hypothetical protein n=1 Tax=Spongiactinospora sp. 9N601 TaxID=3375149 RepID=UPI0037993E66